MPGSRHLSARSRRRPDSVGGAWWWARWLLVLLLAFDHLSAPLHLHRHDGGVDQRGLAAAHASIDDGDTHAQEEEHPLLSHAAMAIRIEPSQLARLPASPDADVQVAVVSAVELLAAFDEPPPAHWRPDRSRPDFRSHRSLPPAGRAPPVHA